MAAVLAAFLLPVARRGRTMTTATGSAASKSSFWASGHWPTLIAAFLYFDLAFMVWVILGPLAPSISEHLGLTPAQKGLMVAVPTLAGAVLRVVNGLLYLPHLLSKTVVANSEFSRRTIEGTL